MFGFHLWTSHTEKTLPKSTLDFGLLGYDCVVENKKVMREGALYVYTQGPPMQPSDCPFVDASWSRVLL
jgi:hypothetical protein